MRYPCYETLDPRTWLLCHSCRVLFSSDASGHKYVTRPNDWWGKDEVPCIECATTGLAPIPTTELER
jgi:hypothetical protein